MTDTLDFNRWLTESGAGEIRYYSLARHALIQALRLAEVKAGDSVLLPEFLCRDLLASLNELGAIPVWYPLGPDLRPATLPQAWPDARAVLMVNYFGFAQPMAPFRAYADRTGAKIIEDNAHGFLSQAESGERLGLRGNMGLFSFRKTFLLGTGAALVVQDRSLVSRTGDQIPEERRSLPWGIRLRAGLRALTKSRRPEYLLVGAARMLRHLRTGHVLPPPEPDAEHVVPIGPAPPAELLKRLSSFDLVAEATRRRGLYEEIASEACSGGCQPVFPALPAGIVPYGMPVYSDDSGAVEELGRRHACDVFRWPDLPDFLKCTPAHYRRLHVVNFL